MTRRQKKPAARRRPPGRRWRILAHRPGRPMLKDGLSIESDGEYLLDEVVLDHWLHLEQLDSDVWWIRVGDVSCTVTVDGQGRIKARTEWER